MVGSHWNRCFWTWPGGVRVCLLLTARCSCWGGCSLFELRWKEESGCGGVFGGQGCSWASPLPFLGCIKCAAYCRAKIVEVVIHRDRSQEHRRWEAPGGGGQAWGVGRAVLLASSRWPSLLENVGAGRCPGVNPGLWAVSGCSLGEWQWTWP